MIAMHLRYAWCSEAELATMLGSSAPITRLRERLEARFALLDRISAEPVDSRAAHGLIAWAREPSYERRPPQRLLRGVDVWAAERQRDDVRALVHWVSDVLDEFDAPGDMTRPDCDDAARLAFLTALAASDFPVLLLWSNPQLARVLFAPDATGRVALRHASVASAKRLRRAALAAATYGCASMRRFGPRDAWIGVAFAREEATLPSDDPCVEAKTLAQIERDAEALAVEPNLAWIARSWSDLPAAELAGGMQPWDYVRARVANAPDRATRERYEARLDSLVGACDAIAANWRDFRAVDGFLHATDALFASTVAPQLWQTDPHRWWISRFRKGEIAVPSVVARQMQMSVEAAYARSRDAALALGLTRELAVAPHVPAAEKHPQPRVAFVHRIATSAGDAILVKGEEITDWVIASPGIAAAIPCDMQARLPPDCAGVTDLAVGGQRFHYAEPNPRRVAERFLALCALDGQAIAYASSTGGLRPLAPPRALVDNRLVRLADENELTPDCARPGDRVGFRSAFITPQTMPLLELELASDAYRGSPQPLPHVFDSLTAVALSFGRVDTRSRIWLLAIDDLRRLAKALPRTRQLVAYFHLEVAALLGDPAWVEALIDGKRCALPTTVHVVFDILANAARSAHAPVAVVAPHWGDGPAVRDERGHQVPAQVYLVSDAGDVRVS